MQLFITVRIQFPLNQCHKFHAKLLACRHPFHCNSRSNRSQLLARRRFVEGYNLLQVVQCQVFLIDGHIHLHQIIAEKLLCLFRYCVPRSLRYRRRLLLHHADYLRNHRIHSGQTAGKQQHFMQRFLIFLILPLCRNRGNADEQCHHAQCD